ncbi:MAG: cyd operon YbgE family protein [Xanthomonadales bacterium]|nr:cyd operon YbgE family protein [Xanthomonadales bacterium]
MTEPRREGQGGMSAPGRMLHSGPARMLSFLMASVFCLGLVFFPQLIIRDGAAPNHWALVLGALGMAAGFVHGVGFVPRKTFFKILLGPLAAWVLMPLGSWLMLH